MSADKADVNLTPGVENVNHQAIVIHRRGRRQPSDVGLAGRIRMPDKSPDEWLAEVEGWQSLGGTHVMAEARRGPLSSVDQHIDAMRQFREVIPVGWGRG